MNEFAHEIMYWNRHSQPFWTVFGDHLDINTHYLGQFSAFYHKPFSSPFFKKKCYFCFYLFLTIRILYSKLMNVLIIIIDNIPPCMYHSSIYIQVIHNFLRLQGSGICRIVHNEWFCYPEDNLLVLSLCFLF